MRPSPAQPTWTAVRAARSAFRHGSVGRVRHQERSAILRRAGAGIDARKDHFARLTTLEVGSPVQSVGRQVDVARLFLDWHADQAETYPWEEDRPGVFSSVLVRREPVGVVGAIAPWNFPLGLTMPAGRGSSSAATSWSRRSSPTSTMA